MGQTWQAFPPRNWEQSASVRVNCTSGQLHQSEDCWDLTGPFSKNLRILVSYAKAHSMPPQEGFSVFTCQNWDLYNHHSGEDRIFLLVRWPLPSSLPLTGDPGRFVLHIGKPLTAMTTGCHRLGHCREPVPQDPGLPVQTLHDGHTDLSDVDVEPKHTGVLVHSTLLVCQPCKTYQAKDLSLSPIDPWHSQSPVILEIQMSLLLLVGLPASGDSPWHYHCMAYC